MKLFSAICASALALAGAGTANATTYTPAGTYVFQGSVNVNKGIALTCVLKLTVVVPNAAPDAHGSASHGHTATATPLLSAGNFLCPTVTFSATPYPVTFDGTNLTLSGVVVNTITPGGCSGSISGVWGGNAASPRSIALNASLPGGGTSAPCTIVGTINQISGPAPVTIVNP
jgi:hypothetical protein